MQSILLALQPPVPANANRAAEWNHVCEQLATKAQQTGGADVLADGVLLLCASDSLPTLGAAIQMAEQFRFGYRVLFVESATEWKRTPPAA